jgi:hypothetical protein
MNNKRVFRIKGHGIVAASIWEARNIARIKGIIK